MKNKNTALFLPGQINDKGIKKKKKLFAICLDKKEKYKLGSVNIYFSFYTH